MNREPRGPLPNDPGDFAESLLRAAGPRPQPDEQLTREVATAVHEHWRTVLATRRRPGRSRRVWAAAAIAAAAMLLLWVSGGIRGPNRAGRTTTPLGTVELVSGAAWLRSPAAREDARPAPIDGAIGRGWVTETGADGHLALRLQGGAQVRLDVDTVARWSSAASVSLERGGLYVDSGDRSSSVPITVRTPTTVARELGTRFEVRFDGARSLLRVREGGVAFRTPRTRATARRGDELTWSEARGLRRRRVPVSGEIWSWVLDAAPPFTLEGNTLEPFLAWVARETGWEIRFVDAALRRSLADATLHGSLVGVRPDEAPASVLPALGLRSRLEDGVLLVEAP